MFYKDKCCSNGQQIWLIDRSSKFFDLKMVELQLNQYLPEYWYPFAALHLIHCSYVLSGERMHERQTKLPWWLFNQIFRPLISVEKLMLDRSTIWLVGWRIVELKPKGLWFQSQLICILVAPSPIIHCSSVFLEKCWSNGKQFSLFTIWAVKRVILPDPSFWGFCNPMNAIHFG